MASGLRLSQGRRARRKVYLLWFLAVLLFAAVPAIGADGFVISRVNFTFLVVAFPIVVLVQWYLERRMVRRAILQLLEEEKPRRGLIGMHRMVVSEDGLFGDLHGVLNSDVALLVSYGARKCSGSLRFCNSR